MGRPRAPPKFAHMKTISRDALLKAGTRTTLHRTERAAALETVRVPTFTGRDSPLASSGNSACPYFLVA